MTTNTRAHLNGVTVRIHCGTTAQHNGVAALVTVICLALLVFCLIKRQVRRALGSDQKMPGLHPGNQQVRPTGRMVLYHLSSLRLRVVGATDPPIIVISRAVQLHLHNLLGLEPAHPRRPGPWTSYPWCTMGLRGALTA